MPEPRGGAAALRTGRTALISGANRGIGAATAHCLFEAGWNLSLGMRRPERPSWGAREQAQGQASDAQDPGSAAVWVAAAMARFGHVHAVVANAGLMIRKTVVEAEDADLEALMRVNVQAPRQLAKAAWAPLCASGRGRVIIVSALSGKRVKSAVSGLYSVSKFAALGLAHAIRHAGFAQGGRATAVCPGFVATDIAFGITDAAPQTLTAPEDIARSIAFLLDLPNTASVAEFAVNAGLEESF